MKRFFLIIFLFFLLGSFHPSLAQSCRFAACDLRGYCPPNPPPGKWLDCKKCLYPNASDDPASGDTLKIADTAINVPPTASPGKMYTQLGCIGTNLGGFQQEGAAAGVDRKSVV